MCRVEALAGVDERRKCASGQVVGHLGQSAAGAQGRAHEGQLPVRVPDRVVGEAARVGGVLGEGGERPVGTCGIAVDDLAAQGREQALGRGELLSVPGRRARRPRWRRARRRRRRGRDRGPPGVWCGCVACAFPRGHRLLPTGRGGRRRRGRRRGGRQRHALSPHCTVGDHGTRIGRVRRFYTSSPARVFIHRPLFLPGRVPRSGGSIADMRPVLLCSAAPPCSSGHCSRGRTR